MPWKVKKNGDKYCVYNADSGDLVANSCHDKRNDAVQQMRALYANSKEFSEFLLFGEKIGMIVPVKFAEKDVNDGRLTKWIQAIPFSEWDHPVYGMTKFDELQAEIMLWNFQHNIRGQKMLTDYDHGLDPAKGGKASGEVLDMEIRTDAMWWKVEFTEEATSEILAGEWHYFSPEWYDVWENPMDNSIYTYVPVGGGITNRPWIKGMVPLNFSEVFAEKGASVKDKLFRTVAVGDDGDFTIQVKGEDGEWRDATDEEATEIRDEHRELEHSEPGTGTPPEPRTDEDPDKAAEQGWRRDSPPPAFEPSNEQKEGSDVKFTKDELEAMGLAEDASDEQVKEAVTLAFSEAKVYRENKKEEQRLKVFSEQFPEEYKELMAQRESRLDNEALKFSERFERIKDDEGRDTHKGFSSVVLETIKDAHKAFSENKAAEGLKKFSETLDLITKPEGIVDYGEVGSARSKEDDFDPESAPKLFAEKAHVIMDKAASEGKPMSWGDAIAAAAKEYPELAKAYSERSNTRHQ